LVKELDIVFKALADDTRRQILDLLRQGPRRTTEIVEAFPRLSRFGVMKHLGVLKEANLVTTRSEGREVFNSLNVVPLRQVYVRWGRKYEDIWAMNLLNIKEDAEKGE